MSPVPTELTAALLLKLPLYMDNLNINQKTVLNECCWRGWASRDKNLLYCITDKGQHLAETRLAPMKPFGADAFK